MADEAIRVLLADDEVHIRYLIRNILRGEGYVVVGEANNGEDALAMFRKHKPDLPLMDINIPLKNGDEVLAEIMKEDPDAKVVMLTMVADVETVRRCLELGAANYILKSNPIDTVRKLLRDVLNPAAIEEEGRAP
jgi:two-component system chemotaxis response regulator CheY